MDATILYYTANQPNRPFVDYVCEHLIQMAGNIPILSISQKPMQLGTNICVGDIGYSVYNVYKQIWIGTQAATTDYVICCEDDTLYPAEHFACRPPSGTFGYNVNRYWLEPNGLCWPSPRVVLGACVVERDLMVEALSERLERYPDPLMDRRQTAGWQEPGRQDTAMGWTPRSMTTFKTDTPVVSFNHRGSLGGHRRRPPTDAMVDTLTGWGNGRALLNRLMGKQLV